MRSLGREKKPRRCCRKNPNEKKKSEKEAPKPHLVEHEHDGEGVGGRAVCKLLPATKGGSQETEKRNQTNEAIYERKKKKKMYIIMMAKKKKGSRIQVKQLLTLCAQQIRQPKNKQRKQTLAAAKFRTTTAKYIK